jgi:hypothetical protein
MLLSVMGMFDGLGGATAGGQPVAPKTDPTSLLLHLDDPTWARMEHAYHNGLAKGETTHIKQLDPHFKWMPGYMNVWTGWMNEGKTEWVYQLLLLRAVMTGKKSAIFSPENMPQEHIYDQLIHSLTGQNPDRDWKACLPMARYKVARDFIRAHFVVVYPGRGEGKTPLDLVRGFDAAVAKFGVSHCLVDPWNKADHSAMASMGGEAPYLVNTLGHLGDWAQDTGQSLIINAHPRQLEGMKHGQARPIPDSSHIAGGQTWENMAHVVATYYRPWKHLGSNNPLYSDVAIYVHKVKSHKLVGRPGSIGDGSQTPDVRITYDWASARYFVNSVSPLNCRAAEECYLTDEELRTRDDQRSAAPAQAPLPAVATPDYQPALLRTASPSEFEATSSSDEGLPADWRSGGRPITLPSRHENV